ncbi:MAG: DEAD/DEAH box helicase [Reyranella sp.]|uniref:DEAD/DEAH box helicase n=1 Tax=Reyranella sp. TaxID=1929291 RepID=UPI003D1304C7
MIELRTYQSERMVAPLREALRAGHKSPLLVAPTGSGKTRCFAHIVHQMTRRGKRIIVLVHRDELIEQVSSALTDVDVKHGIIAAGGFYDRRHLAHVASVQTLVRRLDRVAIPDGVIIDEAHHCIASTSHGKVATFFRMKNPAMWTIGVTATPERLSGEGLGEMFDHMVIGPTVAELIEAGWLSRYRLFAPATVDLSGLHRRAGDFVRGEAAELMSKPKIVGDAVSHYARICNGAPGVAFCVSVEHAEKMAEQFRAYGYRALSVDGSMSKELRRSIIGDFKRGALNILTSCDLISEGLDVPGIHAVMLLRPTQSLAMFLQQVGRGLRPAPGKDAAIILDHVGNTERHGLPDVERQWTLEGRDARERREKDGEISNAVRQCLKCFAISPAAAWKCVDCGEPFPAKPRIVEQVEGELAEIAIQHARREAAREQSMAKDRESLIALAKMRGYKNPGYWAEKVLRGREQKGRVRA